MKDIKIITLANLPESTEQEVFDYMVSNLLKQGKQSKIDPQRCAYRGKDGTKCAAGWLISDEEYEKLFKDNTILNTYTWSGLIENHIAPETHRGLIRRVQRVHDTSEPQYWSISLRTIADDFKLEYKF